MRPAAADRKRRAAELRGPPIGQDEGTACTAMNFRNSNLLLTGISGVGKSSWMKVLASQLAHRRLLGFISSVLYEDDVRQGWTFGRPAPALREKQGSGLSHSYLVSKKAITTIANNTKMNKPIPRGRDLVMTSPVRAS